jgi:hypothetical protein
MFHKTVAVIDLLNTFVLFPTAILAIKGFLTKKSLTPKFDRFFIELFWVEMIIGFVTGSILYHHRLVDISGALYLTAWRVLVNRARLHPSIPSAEELQKKETEERRKRAEKEADEIVLQVARLMKRRVNISTFFRVPHETLINAEALAIAQGRFAEKGWSLSVERLAGHQHLELKKREGNNS